MKVADLGEFGIIERIQKNFSTSSPRIRVGIGDDAALIQVEPDKLQVLTTDMLVEGVHFSRKTAAPQQIGYKSLAVNISDVAAMAGIPVCAVVSLALPPDTPVEFVDGFYQGFARCAEENGVELVGGDTVSCPDRVIINVSLLGEVEPGVYRLRSGAQAGDLIAVTGELGGSAAGLKCLLQAGEKHLPWVQAVRKRHLEPVPRLREGRFLGNCKAVTALNDISDGLASEVREIARASRMGALIVAEKVPIGQATRQAALHFKVDPLEFALFGGEDYELVFTVRPEEANRILTRLKDATGTEATIVGEILEAERGILVSRRGRIAPLTAKGYEHFNDEK